VRVIGNQADLLAKDISHIDGENVIMVQDTVYMFSIGSSENSKTQILDLQSTRKSKKKKLEGQRVVEREKSCDKILTCFWSAGAYSNTV